MSRFTDAERETIVTMWLNGERTGLIAQAVGCTVNAVNGYIGGLAGKGKKRPCLVRHALIEGPLSNAERSAILLMRAEGHTTEEIAGELGRYPGTISLWLKKAPAAFCIAQPPKPTHAAVVPAAPKPAPAPQPSADEDIDLIRPLWMRGISIYAVLDRVNRARRRRGAPQIGTPELHRLVVAHAIQRPVPGRPRLCA